MGGRDMALANPRLLHGDDGRLLLPDGKRPPRLLRIEEFLLMDAATSEPSSRPT